MEQTREERLATGKPNERCDHRDCDNGGAKPPCGEGREHDNAPGQIPGLNHRPQDDEAKERQPNSLDGTNLVNLGEEPNGKAKSHDLAEHSSDGDPRRHGNRGPQAVTDAREQHAETRRWCGPTPNGSGTGQVLDPTKPKAATKAQGQEDD